MPFWHSTHSSSGAGGSRRLTERLFAGWLRRRTRKKSHGPYETLDRCALIRSAMAKVELDGVLRSSNQPEVVHDNGEGDRSHERPNQLPRGVVLVFHL